MKAARVPRFGLPSAIETDDLPRPEPEAKQLLVRVKAAGVGHWDARSLGQGAQRTVASYPSLRVVRNGRGSGSRSSGFKAGDEVYGATNEQFTGAYAEYALPFARTMALHRAASAPIVTVTAWQMLFDYAQLTGWAKSLMSVLRLKCCCWRLTPQQISGCEFQVDCL
jgi:NADPH:quinone reductase-like Zn-dependent oxidoreductase